MNFGDKIKSARRKQGMTQQQLADAVGVSLRTINGYENDNRQPRTHELYENLAETLQVSVNYLKTEDASFLPFVRKASLPNDPGTARALEILQEIRKLFDDDLLTDEAKEALMHGISEAYWVSRKRG